MSKRLIGIEVGSSTLRIAILNQEKNQVSVESLQETSYTDSDELTARLQELFGCAIHVFEAIVAKDDVEMLVGVDVPRHRMREWR